MRWFFALLIFICYLSQHYREMWYVVIVAVVLSFIGGIRTGARNATLARAQDQAMRRQAEYNADALARRAGR